MPAVKRPAFKLPAVKLTVMKVPVFQIEYKSMLDNDLHIPMESGLHVMTTFCMAPYKHGHVQGLFFKNIFGTVLL